jgi:hypothetical protein
MRPRAPCFHAPNVKSSNSCDTYRTLTVISWHHLRGALVANSITCCNLLQRSTGIAASPRSIAARIEDTACSQLRHRHHIMLSRGLHHISAMAIVPAPEHRRGQLRARICETHIRSENRRHHPGIVGCTVILVAGRGVVCIGRSSTALGCLQQLTRRT